jgi:hypothetical protein
MSTQVKPGGQAQERFSKASHIVRNTISRDGTASEGFIPPPPPPQLRSNLATFRKEGLSPQEKKRSRRTCTDSYPRGCLRNATV